MGVLRRRESGPSQAVQGPPSVPDTVGEGCPGLVEFLTAERYPDGAVRRPGTLLLFVDQGCWKACLSDRDQSLVAFVTGASLTDVVVTAERQLQEDRLDWRRSAGGRAKGRK